MTCSLVDRTQPERGDLNPLTQAPISLEQVDTLELRRYGSNELPGHLSLLAVHSSGRASPIP